jgi:hydrogenase maturation protease
MSRTLIAGFGNVLRGDDGFGVEVIRALEPRVSRYREVELMEVGTGGIRMAQELLTPCDCLIIVDAMTRDGPPGSVYVREVESVERVHEVDMHVAIPSRALSVAQALGVLPAKVYIVGCEPERVDDLTLDLSPAVRAAVTIAVQRIEEILETVGVTRMENDSASEKQPGSEIARQDEMLELFFWLEGEGMTSSATIPAITRFIVQPEETVRATIAQLIEKGLVVQLPGKSGEYRLTDVGRREAGRRFADEFSELLNQGHGECNDPTCDCHDNPAAAAECHAARAGGHKH